MKMQVFPGLWVYWYMEISTLNIMDVTHSPFCKDVLIPSGAPFGKSAFRYFFDELRSRLGLHLLVGLGTKKSLLKKARDV